MSSIVVAGTGAKVVKHGNRAASSASGASDVLEKLGVNLDLTPKRVAEVAEEAGITFCFAVKFHPALRHVAAARGQLGIRTDVQLPRPADQPGAGAAPRRSVSPTRGWRRSWPACFAERGYSSLVFRGDDGLDELTTTATSQVWVVRDGKVTEEAFDPRDVGLDLVPGGGAARRRRVVQRGCGPAAAGRRDGAGAGRGAAELGGGAGRPGPRAPGRWRSRCAAGMAQAAESIDSGAARAGAGALGAASQRAERVRRTVRPAA